MLSDSRVGHKPLICANLRDELEKGWSGIGIFALAKTPRSTFPKSPFIRPNRVWVVRRAVLVSHLQTQSLLIDALTNLWFVKITSA